MTTQTYQKDPIEKLYNVVRDKGYYTKTIHDFKAKYSTPESVDALFDVISKEKLYTKPKEDFYNQYFPSLTVEKKSKVGGDVLDSDGRLPSIDADAIRSFVTGKPVEEIKATKQANMKPPAKITTAITQVKSQQPSEESIDKLANNKVEQIADEDLVDPIKGINKLSQANPINAKDILATQKAKDILLSRMASDGFDAKQLLNRTFFGGAGDDNITSRELRNKAADYDKSVAPLREIEVDADLSQANDLYLDYNYKDKIYSAAVQSYAEKHPSFKKELGVTGIDSKDWANLRNQIPNGKMGVIMNEYLSDPNVSSFLQKENPQLLPAFEHVQKNLLKDNNDFAINEVANKVSKAVQKTGFNNIDPIVNYYGDQHKEFADQIANQTLTPEELEVWNKDIRDNQEQYMDAPSLMQGIAEGGEGVFKGIGNTFTEPFRSASESTKRRWEKESSNVSADPQGVFKVMRDTGHVLGLVGAIAGTGNVMGGGGAGIYSSKIVPALSGGVLPFMGDMLEEGRAKYPDSPVKAWTSALFNTSMYAALSQSLFPVKKIQQAIGSVKPEVNNIVERLANGSITKEAARIEANTAFKKALDFVGGTLKTPTKITAELTAIQKLNKGFDYIMMDDKSFEQFHTQTDETKDVLHLWLSNLALGAFSKFGEMKKRNRVAEESYYELASNPKKYERLIDNLSVDKSFGTINEFKENLNHISNVKKELDGLYINPKDQKRFIFESLKEKAAKEEAERTTDPTVKEKSKNTIKEAKEIKEKILAGEDAETIVTQSEQKIIDEQRENEIKLQRLEKDNEIDNKKFDAQRKGLDGRDPDDKLKIEEIEEKRKRANEDFEKESATLKPKQADLSPEQIIIDQADKGALAGGYSELVKQDPSLAKEVLLDYAKQKYGLGDKGETREGGGREITNKVVDVAVTKAFPTKDATISAITGKQEGAAEGVEPSALKEKTDADIENRMTEISEKNVPFDSKEQYEFNALEKEMEKRERDSVFSKPLNEVKDAVDALMKKEKEMPNGWGAFIEKRDARETKEVAEKYLDPKNITDNELKKDFKDSVMGNPNTWYADGLKLRESLKEAANRGIDTQEMVREVENKFIKDGFTSEDAKATVARKLAPIFEGSQQVNEKQIEQKTTPISETKETTQVPDTSEATGEPTKGTSETIPPTTEGTGGGKEPPIIEPPKAGDTHAENPEMSFKKDNFVRARNRVGIDEFVDEGKTTHLQESTKAQRTIEQWKEGGIYAENMGDIQERAAKGQISNQEKFIFAKHLADLDATVNSIKDINSAEYDRALGEYTKALNAADAARSEAARQLGMIPKNRGVAQSLADMMVEEMDSLKVDKLTDKQKENVAKEYEDLQKAKDEFEAYRAKKEDDINKKQAEAEFNKTKSTAKKTKKTHEDFVTERKSLKEELSAARKEHEDWLKEQGIQKSGFGSLTGKEAKVIAKMVKSYVEEGIAKLEEVVSKVFEEVKGVIPNIEERDIRDVIAGAYAEKKKTRNELAATLVDFKREQNLINKLDALFKEAEPTTEKKKIERNQKIAELKKQIKDIQSFEKEVAAEKESIAAKKAKDAESTSKQVDKAEKEIDRAEEKELKQKQAEQDRELKRQKVEAERERKRLEREFEKEKRAEEKARIKAKLEVARQLEKDLSFRTPEEKALDTRKNNIRKGIEKVEEQIKKGDFAPPEKKQPIKLDAEGHKLRDKFMQLKQQRDARIVLNQRMSETRKQKGMRIFTEVMGIPRTLMTIGDFSALLRQNIFFTAGHPLMTAKASGEMFKSAFSQKHYDRWFADLKETKRYQIMQDSRLAIADSLSHDLTKREEEFMSTIAEKLPIVGNMTIKGVPVGLNIVKGSERSYTMLLNKMRVDMFDALAAKMEDRGLTFENSPKQYKALAEYINNATGRSDFGKTLNRIAPVLNNTFFSPRLIASRVNMLTYWAQPRFWKTLPREAKVDYFRNWISLLGTGMIILGLAKWGGADVEDDPRSSDFGKIKSGDTRWDIWGGAQPYVRVLAQIGFGERKSTKSGKIYELNGDDIFGETKGGVAADFFRNKLAPVPGAAVDILSGRTGIGDRIVYQWGGEEGKEISISEYIHQRLLPMTITGTQEALKDQGLKALITVGIPNTFGIGTQTYDANSPTSKKDRKQSKPQKPTKSD